MPDRARPADGLAGTTVVVTRPRRQAATLVAELEAEGARVVVLPLVEIVDVATPDEVTAALAGLAGTDWLVVTSPNAAERVAPALAGCAARVAAVGAATAAVLPHVDLVPARQSAAGLLDELPAGSGRVVVAHAAGADPALVDGLVAMGWRVSRLVTHESRPVVPTAREQLAALGADAVVFTAGSQAAAWVAVFGTTTPPIVATMGPQTARNAESCGLKVDVVATDHSVPGVVRAMREHLHR